MRDRPSRSLTLSELTHFNIRVRSIACGWISIIIAADGAEAELKLDDVTDPVFELADWVCAIQRDGAGTLRIGPDWRGRLVANRDEANAHQIQVWNENDHIRPVLNVCVTTAVLVEAFRNLLNDIEQHPCLASNWVCFIGLSDEQYDRLSDEADKFWEQGVSQGCWSDDWDRQKDFHARFVAEHIELTPEQVDVVERYRTRLRAAIERL